MRDKQKIKEERRKLNQMANAWDPLGLIEKGAPDDEYDYLSDKIYSMLNKDASEDVMIKDIASELENHFGSPLKQESIRNFVKTLSSFRPKDT